MLFPAEIWSYIYELLDFEDQVSLYSVSKYINKSKEWANKKKLGEIKKIFLQDKNRIYNYNKKKIILYFDTLFNDNIKNKQDLTLLKQQGNSIYCFIMEMQADLLISLWNKISQHEQKESLHENKVSLAEQQKKAFILTLFLLEHYAYDYILKVLLNTYCQKKVSCYTLQKTILKKTNINKSKFNLRQSINKYLKRIEFLLIRGSKNKSYWNYDYCTRQSLIHYVVYKTAKEFIKDVYPFINKLNALSKINITHDKHSTYLMYFSKRQKNEYMFFRNDMSVLQSLRNSKLF